MAIKAHRRVQRVVGKGLAWGGAIALVAALVSCASPSFSYIADSSSHTYFKVPYGWSQISTSQLCDTIDHVNTGSCGSTWVSAYEAANSPAATDFGSWTLPKPFVFAQVGAYDSATNGPLTDDTLRDLFLPVTASARQNWESQNGAQLTGFKQIRDATLSFSGGFHGVRETYDMGIDGSTVDTFDQMALADSAGDTVYLIVVHCTTTCYSQDQTAFNDVVSSFTVRSH